MRNMLRPRHFLTARSPLRPGGFSSRSLIEGLGTLAGPSGQTGQRPEAPFRLGAAANSSGAGWPWTRRGQGPCPARRAPVSAGAGQRSGSISWQSASVPAKSSAG